MAEFVQTMKDWRRMCETIQSENQGKSISNWCIGCPIQGYCVIDSAIKDSTNGEISIIGDQIQAWAAEHPEPVYPTWGQWLEQQGICFSRLTNYSRVAGISIPQVFDYQIDGKTAFICGDKVNEPIPADIAEKLGIEPKEGT